MGGAALLTKTGRGLLGRGVGTLLGGAGTEAAAGAAGVSLAPLVAGAAIGAGISYEAVSHRDQIDNWMLQHFGVTGDIAHGSDLKIPVELTGGSVHDRLKANADAIAKLTGQDPSLIYDQLAHETGNGTSEGYTSRHNLSGIEDGHGKYRVFGSDAEYDQVMAQILKRDLGSAVAANIRDYSTRLKTGRYYEDSQANYERGMRAFDGQYGGAGATTVNANITINAKTNASPEDIGAAAKKAVQSVAQQTNVSTLANLSGVHQ